MHSKLLEEALGEFAQDASVALAAELARGAEIPFELSSTAPGRSRRGARPAGLSVYRPLTAEFVRGRWPELTRLPSHGRAVKALEGCHGLERYVASRVATDERRRARGRTGRLGSRGRATAALEAFVEDLFDEQSDFDVRAERFAEAIGALHAASAAEGAALTLVAPLYGVAILSDELPIARGLTITRGEKLDELPDELSSAAGEAEQLLVRYSGGDRDETPEAGLARGRAVLSELLTALRLFGDGRIAYGPLAWARIGGGPFRPVPLGERTPRPRQALVVTEAQEDELRAFCSLAARRAPAGDALAWALARFDLGCSRAHPYEGLTDHLLGLQALLDPDRASDGLLASRVAALCGAPEQRRGLAERVLEAIAFERTIAAGEASEHAHGFDLAREIGGWLKALLSDVICGHLDRDLWRLADELLLDGQDEIEDEPAPARSRFVQRLRGSDAGERRESIVRPVAPEREPEHAETSAAGARGGAEVATELAPQREETIELRAARITRETGRARQPEAERDSQAEAEREQATERGPERAPQAIRRRPGRQAATPARAPGDLSAGLGAGDEGGDPLDPLDHLAQGILPL